jgi:hypothetical protein
VQQSQQFIRISHIPDPGIPRRIFQSVSESCKDERDYEDRVWWMQAIHHVGDEMAPRPEERYSTLTEGVVDAVVEECCEGVAD